MSQILDNDIKFLPRGRPKEGGIVGKELKYHTFNDLLNFYPFRLCRSQQNLHNIGNRPSMSTYSSVESLPAYLSPERRGAKD